MAALVQSITIGLEDLRQEIPRRLGVDFPGCAQFFAGAALRDVLDTITLVWELLARNEPHRYVSLKSGPLLREVAQIFREENLHYELDERGGVHLAVDQTFERNRASTIAGLGRPRYVNVLHNFEEAHTRLTAFDGKGAVTAVFHSAEALFRLMFPRQPRLTANFARGELRPIVQRLYNGNPPATAAAFKEIDALGDWIDAAHNYRHEHGQEEVLQPPLELAVQMVSAGATYIRWLADIDSQTAA